jgi:hypothetical protein
MDREQIENERLRHAITGISRVVPVTPTAVNIVRDLRKQGRLTGEPDYLIHHLPALLAAIDELEVRNAKLEAVAVFMKKRGRKVSDCEAVKTTYVDRRPRFRYCGRCPMCKVWAALDALDD